MTQKPDVWKRVGSKQIADCRVFKVREDSCIRENTTEQHSFFVIENPDWVNIVAITKNGEVVLIEQFRYGTENVILEIPGGMIDREESPETAATRELAEETGYESSEFIFLGSSHPNPAIQDNTIHHFLARNCEKTRSTKFDQHESIKTVLVPYSEAKKLIASGKISHALAIAGFYYSDLFFENNLAGKA